MLDKKRLKEIEQDFWKDVDGVSNEVGFLLEYINELESQNNDLCLTKEKVKLLAEMLEQVAQDELHELEGVSGATFDGVMRVLEEYKK